MCSPFSTTQLLALAIVALVVLGAIIIATIRAIAGVAAMRTMRDDFPHLPRQRRRGDEPNKGEPGD